VGKGTEQAMPTHVVVVNLDYQSSGATTLVGPGDLAVFDTKRAAWSAAKSRRIPLRLPPGGGQLLRVEGTSSKKQPARNAP